MIIHHLTINLQIKIQIIIIIEIIMEAIINTKIIIQNNDHLFS